MASRFPRAGNQVSGGIIVTLPEMPVKPGGRAAGTDQDSRSVGCRHSPQDPACRPLSLGTDHRAGPQLTRPQGGRSEEGQAAARTARPAAHHRQVAVTCSYCSIVHFGTWCPGTGFSNTDLGLMRGGSLRRESQSGPVFPCPVPVSEGLGVPPFMFWPLDGVIGSRPHPRGHRQ